MGGICCKRQEEDDLGRDYNGGGWLMTGRPGSTVHYHVMPCRVRHNEDEGEEEEEDIKECTCEGGLKDFRSVRSGYNNNKVCFEDEKKSSSFCTSSNRSSGVHACPSSSGTSSSGCNSSNGKMKASSYGYSGPCLTSSTSSSGGSSSCNSSKATTSTNSSSVCNGNNGNNNRQ